MSDRGNYLVLQRPAKVLKVAMPAPIAKTARFAYNSNVSKNTICVVCAYGEACAKKFQAQGGRNCPEFERDLSIKEPKNSDAEKHEAKVERK